MSDETPDKPRRKTTRLTAYDYSSPGAYFITICTFRNQNLFGRVANGNNTLNAAGDMVSRWWLKLPEKYPALELDTFIVMPNHFHGLINILELEGSLTGVGADPCVRPVVGLPEVLKWFKTMTTNEYIRGVKLGKWASFDRYLWQRSYYEHVIRRLEDINQVREYILGNPLRWELNKQNK